MNHHVLKLLLDTSGSMLQKVDDTGESLYEAMVNAAISAIRECAQDNQTLHVSVDTFAKQHREDVCSLVLRNDDNMEKELDECRQQLLEVYVAGGTAYFDAGITALHAVARKCAEEGASATGFLVIATDGMDTCSSCNQHPFQGQGRHKLTAAAAAVADKVNLLVLGSDDLSQGTREALHEASQASHGPRPMMSVPATFSRSSSASVSRGFKNVAQQVSQSLSLQTEDMDTQQQVDEGSGGSDFVMVDDDDSYSPTLPSTSNLRRPALRVVTNENGAPFTSIFSPIRERRHMRRAATR